MGRREAGSCIAAPKQWISHVSYSPDGAQIAFVQWDPWTPSTLLTDGEQGVMDADGQNPCRLARTVVAPYDARPRSPVWHPDGRSLLVVQSEEVGLGQRWHELCTNVHRGVLRRVITIFSTFALLESAASLVQAQAPILYPPLDAVHKTNANVDHECPFCCNCGGGRMTFCSGEGCVECQDSGQSWTAPYCYPGPSGTDCAH